MTIQENTDGDIQPTEKNKANEISTSSNHNPSLPQDMILEILLWLPVLSLLRFRSVCKLWLSLISSPEFIRKHFAKLNADSQFTRQRLVLRSIHNRSKLKSCSLYSLFNEPNADAVEVENPMKGISHSVHLVGSCHGLVCLCFAENSLVLWNPATRKLRRLPNSDIRSDYASNPGLNCITHGFCYDECSDDYKLVEILCVLGHSDAAKMKIYSSRIDSWKSVESFTVGFPWNRTGKFANGALHWIYSTDIRSRSPESWIIVSLNMETESFAIIAPPEYENGVLKLTLVNLEKGLSIVSQKKMQYDVWIMKEYGVKESWTKYVSVVHTTAPQLLRFAEPISISENGDILLVFRGRIVVYSSKDQIWRDVYAANYGAYLGGVTYIESLLSPII